MSRQVFVNLPARELSVSVAFFTGPGFRFDPRFSDGNATWMVVADGIRVMLQVEPFVQTFTDRRIADARSHAEVLVWRSGDREAEVDDLAARALSADGRAHRTPQDHGFMCAHGFEDPDGHLRELVRMRSTPA